VAQQLLYFKTKEVLLRLQVHQLLVQQLQPGQQRPQYHLQHQQVMAGQQLRLILQYLHQVELLVLYHRLVQVLSQYQD
jgi:hypothetical protein